jgi:hypothetical protein
MHRETLDEIGRGQDARQPAARPGSRLRIKSHVQYMYITLRPMETSVLDALVKFRKALGERPWVRHWVSLGKSFGKNWVRHWVILGKS